MVALPVVHAEASEEADRFVVADELGDCLLAKAACQANDRFDHGVAPRPSSFGSLAGAPRRPGLSASGLAVAGRDLVRRRWRRFASG